MSTKNAAYGLVACLLAAGAGEVSAQHHGHQQPQHRSHAGRAAGPWPVRVDGSFRAMIHTRDYAPRVHLGQVMHDGATEAVGALSALRGEVTAIDGKLIVSHGKPCADCPPPMSDGATLMVSAKVGAWLPPQTLPSDLKGHALDRFIIDQAKAAGIDVARPFPVRLKGDLIAVKMHVLAAPNPKFGGHGSDHGMAEQENIAADRISGEVVGFYAPESEQGTITHPGEPFHFHWIDDARTRTAHIDAFGMARGAQLLLPRP